MGIMKLINIIGRKTNLIYGKESGDYWLKKFKNCYTVYIETLENPENTLNKVIKVLRDEGFIVDYCGDIIAIIREVK